MHINSSSLISSIIISCILGFLHHPVASKTLSYKWDVGYVYWSPDCIERLTIGINGKFPGPTIQAKAGDTVQVLVKNSLPTEGVVIHWHGITQQGTPWYDGVSSVSQCAINPEETFLYKFKVEKAGTYFYHGHFGMQRAAGLYGMLIVDVGDGEKEPFHYNGEFNLLLSDWYHQSIYDQMVGLSSNPFRWVGEPQSLLMNGRGQYNCSLASKFKSETKECDISSANCTPVVLKVLPNKTYRLRIVSTTSLSSLNLAIGGNHKMIVVEADGNYVTPFSADDMDIYSGESYSVLLVTDQNPTSNYWISVGVRGRQPKTEPALALLNYQQNPESTLPDSPPPITPKWNDFAHSKSFTYKLLARQGTPKPPPQSNRRIALLNTQNKLNGYTKWSINNVSLVLPPTPYLGAMKMKLKHAYDEGQPPENFPADYDTSKPPANPNTTQSSRLYVFDFNSTVDFVIQNANALEEGVSEVHPWHMHGHDFWVVGFGDGKFKEENVKEFNLKNPPLRNTVVVFPYGWTAIRFVASNPGVWPFHCHIEPHLHMGMGVVFAQGIEYVGRIPAEAMVCGMTGKMMTEGHYQP